MINLFGIVFLSIVSLCQMYIKLIVAISSIVRIRIILILIRILLIIKLRFYRRYLLRHFTIFLLY